MFNIQVKGMEELRAQLAGFSDRRFNAAIATAMTRTAVALRQQLVRDLNTYIDRPTPYTVRALKYTAASADKLTAYVGFDVNTITDIGGAATGYRRGETPASNYMTPQIQGGERHLKRAEVLLRAAGHLPAGYLTVPGHGARIDSYGNMERGQIIQILSQLRITALAGTTRNLSFEARKSINAQRKAGGRFFVLPVGGTAAPGVYQREFSGRGITPVLIFVRRATYRKRFDFYGIGQRFAEQRLQIEVRRSIAEHVQRLAAKGPA